MGVKMGPRRLEIFLAILFLSPFSFHFRYHQRAAHLADAHWDILEQRHPGIHCLEYYLHTSGAHYALLYNFPPEKICPWYNFFGYSGCLSLRLDLQGKSTYLENL